MAEQGIAGAQLRSIVERIERMEEEKKAIAADIKEIYAEAKGNGFDSKTIRQVVRIRKLDAAERAEQEAILDLYLHALGMLPPDDDPDGTIVERHKAATGNDKSKKSRAIHADLGATKAADAFAEHMADMGGGSVTIGETVIEFPASKKAKPKKPHNAVGFEVIGDV